jgi:hypothetical protein
VLKKLEIVPSTLHSGSLLTAKPKIINQTSENCYSYQLWMCFLFSTITRDCLKFWVDPIAQMTLPKETNTCIVDWGNKCLIQMCGVIATALSCLCLLLLFLVSVCLLPGSPWVPLSAVSPKMADTSTLRADGLSVLLYSFLAGGPAATFGLHPAVYRHPKGRRTSPLGLFSRR